MLFNKSITLDFLNALGRNTMVENLGIRFTAIGEDFLEAIMPVNEKTRQPQGLLHGGANVTLAETMGSVAAALLVDPEKQLCVGLEINANHLRPVTHGTVTGIAKPIHLGKKTQVWEIKIFTEQEDLSCISRITIAVLDKR